MQNKPEPVIFLHIQKTAGTSLVHLAAEQYGVNSIISHGDYVNKSPLEFSSIPFVSGHFGFAYIEPLIKNRKIFTFLREPRERIISLYYYFCKQPIEIYPIHEIAHNNSFESFLELGLSSPLVYSRIWNHQAWQLAYGYDTSPDRKFIHSFTSKQILSLAKYHLCKMDFIGIVERMDKDVEELSMLLNWSGVCKPARVNVTSNRKSLSELSNREIMLLDELTSLDKVLYDAAIRMKSRRS
jgi:hypothetical protein